MMNNSEALFTFWQNTSLSDHDNQTEHEFPQWRLVVSFLLLGLWLLSGSLTTALSFSVLLAVMKSSINRKLGLIHIYVLVMNIFVRVCTALAFSSLMPPVIRFCECSTMTNFISLYLLLFNIDLLSTIHTGKPISVSTHDHQREKEICQLQDNWNHTPYNNSSDDSTANSLFWSGHKPHWGRCCMSQHNGHSTIVVHYYCFPYHYLGTLCLYFGSSYCLVLYYL